MKAIAKSSSSAHNQGNQSDVIPMLREMKEYCSQETIFVKELNVFMETNNHVHLGIRKQLTNISNLTKP